MEVLYSHCCGIDAHKQTAVACVVVQAPTGRASKEIRTFGTMTADLLTLGDWLETCGVTRVATESAGLYWKPLWNLMEDCLTLLLVSPQHVKAVPGRKSDVRDCEWLAGPLHHGLLKPSYVPDRAQRELRELVRYRTRTVAIPHWATAAPPKSNGAPQLGPLRPNQLLHQNESSPPGTSHLLLVAQDEA